MDRNEIDELLIEERYGGGESNGSPQGPDAELYQQAKTEADVLDGMLAWSDDEPPRPGFDTRFYARLKDVQEQPEKKPSRWQRLKNGIRETATSVRQRLVKGIPSPSE